jgi:hypothetical protein
MLWLEKIPLVDKSPFRHFWLMKSHIGLAALASALVVMPPSVGIAAENEKPASSHTISEFKLGAHISGDEVKLDQAKGKVVAIVYWGIH